MRTPYRLFAGLGGVLVALLVVGCGDGGGVQRPVAGEMLLSPAALPTGFTTAPLSVAELTSANAEQLRAAETTRVTPEQCRPVADAEFNTLLTPVNSAVLAATGLAGSITELVSMATRNVSADVRAGTGECAVTTTAITKGSFAGATIKSDHVRLDAPALDSSTAGYVGQLGALRIVDIFLVRTTTTTTLAGGAASSTISLAGYATGRFTFDATDVAPLTVQLTATGESSEFATPAPAARAPMSDQDFRQLFAKALVAAGEAPQ